MAETKMVNAGKKLLRTIKWLLDTTDKTRPGLGGLHVASDCIWSSDGVVLKMIPVPKEVEEAGLEPMLPYGGEIAQTIWAATPVRIEPGPIPSPGDIIPRAEATSTVVVNVRLLHDILEGLTGLVRINLRSDPGVVEILGNTKDERPAYALLMSMSPGNSSVSEWKPMAEKVEKKEEVPDGN